MRKLTRSEKSDVRSILEQHYFVHPLDDKVYELVGIYDPLENKENLYGMPRTANIYKCLCGETIGTEDIVLHYETYHQSTYESIAYLSPGYSEMVEKFGRVRKDLINQYDDHITKNYYKKKKDKNPDHVPNCIRCRSEDVFEDQEGQNTVYHCRNCDYVFSRKKEDDKHD